MSRKALYTVLLLCFAAGASQGQTLIYEHQGSPLFSIEFPEGWLVDLDFEAEAREAGTYREGEELEIRILEANPGDGAHIWVGLWALPDARTLDEGVTYFTTLNRDLFTDLEVSEPEARELNGMAARILRGTAKRDGEAVELTMALFEARPGTIAAGLYVGAPDAWRTYREELESMLASLAPAA